MSAPRSGPEVWGVRSFAWGASPSAKCLLVAFAIIVGTSCEPRAAEGTGGVGIDETLGSDGRSCGRGITVSMTDYESSNVALVGLDGTTLSGSFISSASAETTLSSPLTEAVFPGSMSKKDIVILDRFPASVLTFVDPKSAKVRTQVSVRTGFDANPQDYLDLGDGRALVTRLEKNPTPGSEAHDEGDDLVWLDLSTGEITGRIDLGEVADAATGRARPSQMRRLGDTILVTLTGHSATFTDAAPGRLLALDAESGEILGLHEIEGTKNCVGMDLSPTESSFALSCSDLIGAANEPSPPASALVVVEVSRGGDDVTFDESFRLTAADVGFGPFTPAVSFADDDLVLVGTYGSLEGEDAGRPDRVLAVSLSSGDTREVLRSAREPFSLGDVRCVEPCEVCFVADAGRGVLHRYPVEGGALGEPSTHVVETEIGLPPRGLGQF